MSSRLLVALMLFGMLMGLSLPATADDISNTYLLPSRATIPEELHLVFSHHGPNGYVMSYRSEADYDNGLPSFTGIEISEIVQDKTYNYSLVTQYYAQLERANLGNKIQDLGFLGASGALFEDRNQKLDYDLYLNDNGKLFRLHSFEGHGATYHSITPALLADILGGLTRQPLSSLKETGPL